MPKGGVREGAGRPATGRNTKCITLTLTKDGAEKLTALAQEQGLSVSELIAKTFDLPVKQKAEPAYAKKTMPYLKTPSYLSFTASDLPVAAEDVAPYTNDSKKQ